MEISVASDQPYIKNNQITSAKASDKIENFLESYFEMFARRLFSISA